MGAADQRLVSTGEWGELVKSVLTNKLVSYLFELDEEALSRPSVVAILEEELRPFLELKAEVQSQRPRESALELAHDKLLELMQRSFMVAQQALLNRPRVDEGDKSSGSRSPDEPCVDTRPGGKRLLTWHVARMNDIGTQFMSALAEVSEKRRNVYDQLDLPAGIIAKPTPESVGGTSGGTGGGKTPGRMARRRKPHNDKDPQIP